MRKIVVETIDEDNTTTRDNEVKLPQFLNPSSKGSIRDARSEELLDFKDLTDRTFDNLSNMRSIAMSVPAFLTIIVLLAGVSFFAGRFSILRSEKAQATVPGATLQPVSISPQGSSPIQGTPEEIIKAVREEFAVAITKSKKTNPTDAEKEEVSKTIIHILDVLSQGISAYPDVASLYFERAQIEKMVMQSAPSLKPQAESDYLKALSLSPLTGEYYVGFADYLSVMGDHAKAIQNFEKAIQLDPKNVEAMYPLAKLYADGGRSKEAILLLKKISSQLSPGSEQYAQIQKDILVLEGTASSVPTEKTATASANVQNQ